jgi:hypothetical protein
LAASFHQTSAIVLPFIPLLVFAFSALKTPSAGVDPVRAVSLVDYAFIGLPAVVNPAPARREQWIVRNKGRALHEVLVLRLRDSSEFGAVDAWIARGASELLPPAPIALRVAALLPGEAARRELSMEPGVYIALCFVPAGRGTDGAIMDHAHLGMRHTFVVGAR